MSSPTYWTQDRIIAACHQWTEQHGEHPPSREWRHSAPEHPNHTTVIARFGSWNAMIRAAGYKPRRSCGPTNKWTTERIEFALLEWRFVHGHLPEFNDWVTASPDYPTASVVVRRFGSWNAAIVAAGYEPKIKRRSIVGYQHQAGAATRELVAA